jgi:hypothetical protein
MSESYTHHHPPHDPGVRAGDRDRDAVADVLREHHLAGRLATDEFQKRLDRCYAAKTYAELDELVADLPREAPVRPTRRPRRWPAVLVLPALIAAIALSHGHLVWLAIPLFFFFVGRPLLWRSRRFGWGFAGCGARQTPPPGSYV